jgi:hypothetical protein
MMNGRGGDDEIRLEKVGPFSGPVQPGAAT